MSKRSALAGRVLRGAAIGVVLIACALFLQRLDLASVGVALRSASLPLLLLAAAANLAQVGIRSLFLKTMLAPVRTVGVARLFRYNLAMFAANNLLPWRGGELVRIYLLKAREQVPPAASVAVALVEKVFDAVALLLLALPLPLLMPNLPRSVTVATIGLGAAGLVALAATWALAHFGKLSTGRLGRFASGAAVVRRGGTFAAALGWSLAAHLVDAGMIAICLAATHIHVPPATPLLILLALAVVLAVPSTPSGIGALEMGAVGALQLLGVDAGRALAFALVYHAIQSVPVTLLGLDGMRLAAAGSAEEEAKSGAEGVGTRQ